MTSDQSTLMHLYDDVNELYEKTIQPLEIANNLLGIKQYSKTLNDFKETFKKVQYLGIITPLKLWEFYSQIVSQVNLQ